jgi:hypothetical protein
VLARQAIQAKRAHEWGYRWTWPPRIADLSPRELRLIGLAEQAEAYVAEERRNRQRRGRGGGESLTQRHANVSESRREWESEFQ